MTENPQGFWRRKAILAALFIAVLLPAGGASADAASPEAAWNVTFTLENENKFDAVAPSADGGIIAIGSTLSRTSGGEEDVMLVKTDGAGNQVWLKRLPGMAPASVAGSYTHLKPPTKKDGEDSRVGPLICRKRRTTKETGMECSTE